jgi:hypothetical protein
MKVTVRDFAPCLGWLAVVIFSVIANKPTPSFWIWQGGLGVSLIGLSLWLWRTRLRTEREIDRIRLWLKNQDKED